MIFGITGKSGSGKSTLAKHLAFILNGVYLDVDSMCHFEMNEIHEWVCDVLNIPVGASRKEIGAIFFSNKEKYDEVTNKLWPRVEKKIIEKIENNKVVIIDHIFLPKMTTILSMLDFKILVKCDNDLRIERILERDKISIEYLQKREQTAIEYNESEYDRVIDSEELTCLIK